MAEMPSMIPESGRVANSSGRPRFIGFDADDGQFGDFGGLWARLASTYDQTGLEWILKSVLEVDVTRLE